MKRLTALLLLLLLCGCTATQISAGLQARERNLCAEGPQADYAECLERIEAASRESRKQPRLKNT